MSKFSGLFANEAPVGTNGNGALPVAPIAPEPEPKSLAEPTDEKSLSRHPDYKRGTIYLHKKRTRRATQIIAQAIEDGEPVVINGRTILNISILCNALIEGFLAEHPDA